MRMWLRGALLVAVMVTWSASSSAQPQPQRDVAELHIEGKRALKERRLEDAIRLFQGGLSRSTEEVTRWSMLLGLALAYELKEEWVPSAANYQAFLSRSADHPDAQTGKWAARRRSATQDVSKIEPEVLLTHARVSLTTTPTDAVVVAPPGTAGEVESRTPVSLYLAPGQHQLEIRKEGHASMILVVSIEIGQRVTVQRALLPLEQTAPLPAPEPPPPEPGPEPVPSTFPLPNPPPPPSSPILKALGWTMVAVGAVGIGGGVGFVVAAANTVSDLDALNQGPLTDDALAADGSLRGDLRDFQAGAAAMFAGGGALALGGTLILLLRPGGPLAVTPTVGAGTLGLRAHF